MNEREKNCAYCCHNSSAIRSPNVAVCTNKNEERGTNKQERNEYAFWVCSRRDTANRMSRNRAGSYGKNERPLFRQLKTSA